MVSLFGKLLKLLPIAGAALILAAIGRSVRDGYMDQLSLAFIGLGFLFFLAMFLKIELASLRYYLNLSILTVEMAGILVLLYLLTVNHDVRLDLTANARNSLSPQTRLILNNLVRRVEVKAMVVPNDEPALRRYLRLYADETDKFSFEIKNPYKAVSLFDIPVEEIQVNDVLIQYSDGETTRTTRFRYQGADDLHLLESDLVNGILKVLRERPTRLYFSSGHGEKPPMRLIDDEGSKRSIVRFAAELHAQGLEVRAGLDLRSDRLVPDDCDMLAIVGPSTDYGAPELEAIRAYLERGGSLLLLLDPPESEAARRPGLRSMVAGYGVLISEDLLWDSGSYAEQFNEFVPLVHEYSQFHPITEGFVGRLGPIAMPKASPIEKSKEAPPDLNIQPLLVSSPQSWTLTLFESLEVMRAGKITRPGPDKIKQHALGMAVGPKAASAMPPGAPRPTGKRPRIVVFGDSDFLTDAQLGRAQLNLGYSAVAWLTRQDNLVAVGRPADERQAIVLDRRQRTLVSVFSVVIVPFAVFFGGLGYTTIRRRKR